MKVEFELSDDRVEALNDLCEFLEKDISTVIREALYQYEASVGGFEPLPESEDPWEDEKEARDE